MDSKIKELWGDALSYIRSKIEETAFQTWFDGLEINAMNEDSITLIVPNRFHYEWLESKYRSLINNAIKSAFGKSLIVLIESLIISRDVFLFLDNISQLMFASNIDSKGKKHTSKNIKEGQCIFPFKYNRKMKNECVESKNGPWCPTALDSDDKTVTWGYCVQKQLNKKSKKLHKKIDNKNLNIFKKTTMEHPTNLSKK